MSEIANEEIIRSAEHTCEEAIKMPDRTEYDVERILEFIRIEEAKICKTEHDREIWRTAFVFHHRKNLTE